MPEGFSCRPSLLSTLVILPGYALGLYGGSKLFGLAKESTFRLICYPLDRRGRHHRHASARRDFAVDVLARSPSCSVPFRTHRVVAQTTP